MRFEDIKIDALNTVTRTKDRCKTYFDPNYYYKIWDYHHTAFHTQTGFDRTYLGMNQLASVQVGLVNDDTCHAFVDTLIDENNICRGYVMHRGLPVEDTSALEAFTNVLAENSLRTGYGIVDVNPHNVIVYDGRCSIIDIDFCPIKLLHGKTFNDIELERWYISFYNQDRNYLNQLLNGIAQGKCK